MIFSFQSSTLILRRHILGALIDRIALLLQEVGEQKGLEYCKHNKQLDGDDGPHRTTPSHTLEPIDIEAIDPTEDIPLRGVRSRFYAIVYTFLFHIMTIDA